MDILFPYEIGDFPAYTCNVVVFYVLVYFVLYYVSLAIMLRVPILRSCKALLCLVNTLSGLIMPRANTTAHGIEALRYLVNTLWQ